MRGDPLAVIETFDRRGGHAHVDLLLHQAMRDTVVVAVDVDVVVDVDDRRLPLGVLVAGGRQRLHPRAVDGVEGALPRAGQFLERTLIEIDEQSTDSGVELFEREELAIAQPRQNPSLGQEYARLYGSFVTGFIGPRREDGRGVVTC